MSKPGTVYVYRAEKSSSQTFFRKNRSGALSRKRVCCAVRLLFVGNAEDDARVDTFTDSYLKTGTLSTDFLFEGKAIDSKQKAIMRRVENPKEAKLSRKLISIHSAIEEAANQLGLNSGVVRCAFDLYSDCSSLMHIRGKRSEIIVSACLYLACRIMKSYRLLSEIVSVLLSDLRKTARLSQVIISELKLVIDPPTDVDYIGRYCSVLLLPRDVYSMALRVLESIKEGNYPNVGGSALNVVVVLMASRICDMEDAPSVEQLAAVSMKSEQSVIRLYACWHSCDA